ncbi:MAG: AraC family transcriptional regulator [Armatimonadetes bacterium]|nr:AraC family transcriptional regulator [Armatimonadota bacterium]
MASNSEAPTYEHQPGSGKLLHLDGAWSFPRAKAKTTVTHPACEVGMVLHGEESILFEDGHEAVFRRGEVWLCNAWEVHGWAVADCGVRTVVPHFLPEFLGEADVGCGPWQTLFAAPASRRPYVRDERTRLRFCAIGEDLSRESLLKRPSWTHLVRLQVLYLLTELARDWEPQPIMDGRAERGPRVELPELPARLLPAFVFVRSAHPHKVSVSQAAKACAMSRSRFEAEFRQAAGVPFGRFCLQMRLKAAARLLASSDLTVKEVAATTGFWDDSHLHRFFLREYGQTPSDYRASHLKRHLDRDNIPTEA